MNQRQTVSLILPNYNHAAELRTSLACIVEQTRPFDEIIVVDDGSTDDSLRVIEEFAAQRPQLRLLRNAHRLGVPETVNRGLEAASCDYVVLASADERISTEMCEMLMEAAARFPRARLAVSLYSEWDPATGATNVHDGRSPLGMWYMPDAEPRFFSPDQLIALLESGFVWLSVNSALFRREALLQAGGFDPALRWHSDWFAIYAIAFRHGFCAVPKPLASFRRSPRSYSGQGMRDPRAQTRVMVGILRKLHAPENRDLLQAMKRAPAALSPFMRWMGPVLATRPAWHPLLVPVARWWVGEVLKGRRPGALARFTERYRAIGGK